MFSKLLKFFLGAEDPRPIIVYTCSCGHPHSKHWGYGTKSRCHVEGCKCWDYDPVVLK